MTERSGDFEFDFFEEPATEEAAQRAPARRGRPRRPVRPPSGLTPLLRLIGLVAFAILVVTLLVFWVQSCRADSKRETYTAYMEQMRQVARESEAVGRNLDGILTERGIKQAEIPQRLGGLIQREDQIVANAQEVDTPGRLRTQHRHAVEALQLRSSGLRLLSQSFARTAGNRGINASATLIAAQMRRLLASDVLWEDLFRAPALDVLREQELLGINVPRSRFLDDPDLATERGIATILRRIRGAGRTGIAPGAHGNGLISVRALPGGEVLDPDGENNVRVTADLRFEAVVENSGDSQEVEVPVRLTIQQAPEPIVRTQTIESIDPRRRETVTFGNLGDVQIGAEATVRVTVEKVPGEQNLANNTEDYEVAFVLIE